jgi:hypothetical protein
MPGLQISALELQLSAPVQSSKQVLLTHTSPAEQSLLSVQDPVSPLHTPPLQI